jgi:hypothetical protein
MGTNFTSTTLKVTFGTVGVLAASVTGAGTTITVTTPAHAVGKVTVRVHDSGGTVADIAAYKYVSTTLTITSISPPSGPTAGHTSVTITGTNFASTSLVVTFGTAHGTNVLLEEGTTEIVVTTPTHAPGKVAVTVTDSIGSVTKAAAFQFIPPAPTITTVSPASGPSIGGTPVLITGTNFAATTLVVTFGTAAVHVVSVRSTGITVTTPVHVDGTVKITVTDSGGSVSKATGFTFVPPPPPTITTVSPATGSAAGGTSVLITGTNFTATTLVIKFGTTIAHTFSVKSATQITVTSPVHAAGKVAVKVSDSGGSVTKPTGFKYVAPPSPTITTISPATGPTVGGTAVLISGTNLVATTLKVTFGSTAGLVPSMTGSKIKVTTPAHVVGKVTVKVTDSGGSVSKATGFTYIVELPTISKVTPPSGSSVGTTPVTLTGTNLNGATSVKFGGSAVKSFTVKSATQISVVTEAHAAGKVSIVVTTPGGSVTDATAFTYLSAPTIVSFTPTSGPATGGTSVVITGTNLTKTSIVSFGGTDATIHVTSSTKLTVTTRAEAAGTVGIWITTPAGTVKSTSDFKFVAAPTVTKVTPSSGPTTGKSGVVITGTHLTGASVTVGGVAATVTKVGSTSITVTVPAGTAGAKTVAVTTVGGKATLAKGFTYVS